MFSSVVRGAVAIAALLVGLTLAASSAAQQSDPGKSGEPPGQAKKEEAPASTQTQGQEDGHGANQSGPYDPNGVGAPSGNGRSEDNNGNRPCAGCVGNADAKNPPGQLPGGSDPNRGYECDENQGVGKTNPAHSGCGGKTTTPPGGEHPGGEHPGGEHPGGGPPGGGPPGGGPHGGGPSGNPPTGGPEQPTAPSVEVEEAPQGEVLGQRKARDRQPAVNEEAEQPAEQVVAGPGPEPGGEGLPFTGWDLLTMVLLGAACLVAGAGIARLISPRRVSS